MSGPEAPLGGRRGGKRERVREAKTPSSRAWLQRQLNDPYVRAAKREGYRSRAAYKLIELDDKFRFLKKGAHVLDLGAAPGGWSQVAAQRTGGVVVAVDILPIEPVFGVTILTADLTEMATETHIVAALGARADVVLSDMAAPTTGHRATDHLRTTVLIEAALDVAIATLKPGGVFVGKVFQGGATRTLLTRIKRSFTEVRHVKPPASRAGSVELYVVALNFKG